MCISVCLTRARVKAKSYWDSFLCCYPVESKAQIQVIGPTHKLLYLLSHLTGSYTLNQCQNKPR